MLKKLHFFGSAKKRREKFKPSSTTVPARGESIDQVLAQGSGSVVAPVSPLILDSGLDPVPAEDPVPVEDAVHMHHEDGLRSRRDVRVDIQEIVGQSGEGVDFDNDDIKSRESQSSFCPEKTSFMFR